MASAIDMQEKKKRRDSMALSLIIHAFLLLFFLFPLFSFYSKNEPPRFQGIQVALGDPQIEQRNTPAAKQEKQEEKKVVQKKTKAAAKPSKATKSKSAPQKVVSQTREDESPVVATKKKVVSKKTDAKAEAKKKAKLEANKQREAEEARKKAEEEAKKEAEEAERAEEARKKAEAAKKKADAKKKFQGLLDNSSSTAPAGGQENGHPNAEALKRLSTGKGRIGDGLGDRKVLYAPQIKDNSQKTGRVKVNICVNAAGKVIKAQFTQKGSTTTDANLIDLALEGAEKYEFSTSKATEQCGEITIDFKLK